MTQTIAEMRRQGDRLDERVRQDYEVSVEEAAERLEQLRYGLIQLANFFAVKRPPGSEP